MFPTKYFASRYFPERYWPKAGSDVAHVLAAIIFSAPVRRVLTAPFRRWR